MANRGLGRGFTAAYLGLGVILGLSTTPDDGPFLAGVDEVAPIITHDAGGAGVDESLDIGLLTGSDDGAGAVDIDLLEDGIDDSAGTLGRR